MTTYSEFEFNFFPIFSFWNFFSLFYTEHTGLIFLVIMDKTKYTISSNFAFFLALEEKPWFTI